MVDGVASFLDPSLRPHLIVDYYVCFGNLTSCPASSITFFLSSGAAFHFALKRRVTMNFACLRGCRFQARTPGTSRVRFKHSVRLPLAGAEGSLQA